MRRGEVKSAALNPKLPVMHEDLEKVPCAVSKGSIMGCIVSEVFGCKVLNVVVVFT